MREVGAYSFSATRASSEESERTLQSLGQMVKNWVGAKGRVQSPSAPEAYSVQYRDGRIANIRQHTAKVGRGEIQSWQLDEPPRRAQEGAFRTTIAIARAEGVIAVSCRMESGHPENILSPKLIDAHCPGVIRDILRMQVDWEVSGDRITINPVTLRGVAGAERLKQAILNPSRKLPLVVISEFAGNLAFADLDDRLAHEVVGLAIVLTIDEPASLALTEKLGKEWSCYNGAVRIYWPQADVRRSPFYHPLWTLSKLWDGTLDGFCKTLRRRMLGLSAYANERHVIFSQIESETRSQELAEKAKAASAANDYQALAEAIDAENARLRGELEQLKGEVGQLKEKLYREQELRQYYEELSKTTVAPPSAPPVNLTEAVDQARREFAGALVFGDNVQEGLRSVNAVAVPPEKLLEWLSKLARASREMSQGSLGKDLTKWLCDEGCRSSGESETVKGSRQEKKKRTWHDGDALAFFELHMKLKEATRPSDCVRVYFRWCEKRKMIAVGWVGRHP